MNNHIVKKGMKRWVAALIIFSVAAVVIGVTLIVSIYERKQEDTRRIFVANPIADDESDPAKWGANFPFQYETYLKTVDQSRTKYGGSEAWPRSPTQADPRTIVSQQKLSEDPRLKEIWAGYAFGVDFREERGHAFMFEDQKYTERQQVVKQPGACLNCHASAYTIYKKLGDGDTEKGFHTLNKMPYDEAKLHAKYPVCCIDCHVPNTMQLRVTRPAFISGIRSYKEFQGIKDYDVNRDASYVEMRSFVCAQCHVEYYFKGPEKTLTYPWSNGLKADEIMSYYEKNGHKDWVHKKSGAEVLKAQHPEFEVWSQGIHARSNVSCADCHMPVERQGAMKVSSHQVRSPLLNIRQSCLTCHKFSESEMLERVEIIQDRHTQLRNLAMNALVELINDIAGARDKKDFNQSKIKQAQVFQKKAQFYLDFMEAENSTGFHAPQEAARILGLAIDEARKGQNALR